MPKLSKTCASCGSEFEPDALFCPKDGMPLGSSRSMPGDDPYVGALVAEQIELRQVIGIGSMGRVYRAFQRGIERDVAVKLLHRELSSNLVLIGRFLREARIASRLAHPNVVQVLMSGQLPPHIPSVDTGASLYIVMEYLDGISLMSALAACGGAMPLPRALHVILQICDAVGEAHAKGIVHRDLKPENVMLVRRGDDSDYVKVLDFGIARLAWGEEAGATQAGLIFGTARYISPEGSQGEAVDPPADVYAIATMLYQAIAGRTPFDSDSSVALLLQHAHEDPPPITSIARASYLPAPLAAAIMRNLSKNPKLRASDARALGRELVDAAKASGMSPDELVLRSTLLGQRSGHGTAFTSIERTNKMPLTDVASKSITQASEPVSIDLLRPSRPSLDSSSLLPAVVQVELSTPWNDMARLSENPVSTGFPQVQIASLTPRPSLQSFSPAPPSTDVESTLDDDDIAAPSPASEKRRKTRLVAVIIAGFLAGASLVAFGAKQLGYLGKPDPGSARAYLERTNVAINEHRWESPPANNVKDITDEALQRFPGDRAILESRERAADELVASALGKKYAGDIEGALAQAALARTLNPTNSTAQHLVQELEAIRASNRPSAASATPPLAPAPTERPPRISSTSTPPKKGSAAPPVSSLPPAPPTPTTVLAPPPPPPPPSTTTGRWL